MKALAIIALAAGTAACGSSFDPSTALDGAWALTPAGVPGSGIRFTLADDGGQVTGTGARFIEAGPTLAFTVSGTQDGNEITLHFNYASGEPDDFTGRLTDATHLKGALHVGGDGSSDSVFERSAP